MTETELNELTEKIIGVAIKVHKELGPGLLEKVYQRCLKIALEEEGLHVDSEVPVEVIFHGKKVADEALRIDLLVENQIVLELKSASKLTDLYQKQLGTYLKLAKKPCGLLINFNEVLLKNGIKRVKNGYLK
ncbi:MAG: GxxExxY protein [Treponema sp.]|uniref:GxxExxY protein n=1 Tax=Treponema sp. TaxID=166 RepID=UPI002A918F38|nr:GxxExxY protein [Treponema sp.]MBQ9622194.1 GxxExxY protein [Treponema sp.]MBR0100619.1 GxxExxY protein [Treponema sp.]MDY6397160.1 GxxExxY protein [Treponema sp.]